MAVCNSCQKEVGPIPKKYLYCQACRREHWQAKNPSKIPKPSRPQGEKPHRKPNKGPKPPHKPAAVNVTTTAMRGLSMKQSQLGRVAKQTSAPAKSSSMRLGRSSKRAAVKAVNLLMSMMLNPTIAQPRPMKFFIDESSIPKKGMIFTSAFNVRSTSASTDFKILFLPSPIIIAEIISNVPLQITGTKVISLQNEDNQYVYYVVGSKVGFVGTIDNNFIFTPREDYSQYRILAMSASCDWFGKQLDKNGTYYASRITNREDLSEFDLLSKPDSLISNMDGKVVLTGQQIKPTYEFEYIDDNDDETEQSKPDAKIVEYINLTFSNATRGSGSYPAWRSLTKAVNVEDVMAFIVGVLLIGDNRPALNSLGAELQRKYGDALFHTEVDATGKAFVVFNQNISFLLSVNYYMNNGEKVAGWNSLQLETDVQPSQGTQNIDFAQSLVTNMGIGVRAMWTNFSAPPAFAKEAVLSFNIRAVLRGTDILIRRPYQMAKISTNIIPDIVEGHDQLTHMGSNIRSPVLQVQSEMPFLQFQHVVVEEMVIEDDSVLTLDAIATNDASDQALSVNLVDFKRFTKIMSSMPPMLEYNDGVIGQTGQQELANRGILGTIAGILGPIAAAIFPPVGMLLPVINDLVTGVEGIIG